VTVFVPAWDPTFAGTCTFGGIVGKPGRLQLVMLQTTVWWLVNVIEVAPMLIVPPAHMSMRVSPLEDLVDLLSLIQSGTARFH
jgi:hypothetical protein